ncbi:hypothetical protein FB451DRAFT_1197861 [Mycena latifolia]|nr:hypothetical protein FB451DRAFT_1197861 [Mycena latifolia]
MSSTFSLSKLHKLISQVKQGNLHSESVIRVLLVKVKVWSHVSLCQVGQLACRKLRGEDAQAFIVIHRMLVESLPGSGMRNWLSCAKVSELPCSQFEMDRAVYNFRSDTLLRGLKKLKKPLSLCSPTTVATARADFLGRSQGPLRRQHEAWGFSGEFCDVPVWWGRVGVTEHKHKLIHVQVKQVNPPNSNSARESLLLQLALDAKITEYTATDPHSLSCVINTACVSWLHVTSSGSTFPSRFDWAISLRKEVCRPRVLGSAK